MFPEEYDKLAAAESHLWYFRALHALLFRLVQRRIDPRAAAEVLDAGCGTGGLLAKLQAWAPAWRARGLDLSPLACAYARRQTGSEIVEGSILAMPFADNSFDLIVAIDSISHLDDPALGLRETARCARPGATLALNVAAFRWLWSYHDERVQKRRRFTRHEFAALCRAAGLEVELATYVFLPTFPLLVAKRKLFRARGSESDVRVYPRWLDRSLSAVSAVERAWIAAGMPSPIGSSVFILARKPLSA